ncbi:MAG: hypothetical protein JJU00_20050, partial [Opitutales bacterium]|nr:hypothetical protein [Opitutales bacterium]
MKFSNWLLQLPDGTETGPITADELRRLLPEDETSLTRTRIRSKRETSWVTLPHHPDCQRFLTKGQQDAVLKSIMPSPLLPVHSMQPPAEQTTETVDMAPVRQDRIQRPQLKFTSVEEILDFNAVCDGQDLVRDRTRHHPRAYRQRSRFVEFISGIIFYNALFFVLCYAVSLLISSVGFQKAVGPLYVLALQGLLNNPISSMKLHCLCGLAGGGNEG